MYVEIVTAHFKADTQAERDAIEPAFRQALLDTKGLHKYVAGNTDPDTIIAVGIWESVASLQAFNAENAEVLDEIGKLLASEVKVQAFEVNFEV